MLNTVTDNDVADKLCKVSLSIAQNWQETKIHLRAILLNMYIT